MFNVRENILPKQIRRQGDEDIFGESYLQVI